MPLGFVFTSGTDAAATTGAKKRVLIEFFKYFKKRCPNVKITLSDKERAEVDALRASWPDAKHQTCYWHIMHYIETRLGENKPPAAYDPRKAAKLHDFVDPTWAPGVVGDPEDARNEAESGGARPGSTREAAEEMERDTAVRGFDLCQL